MTQTLVLCAGCGPGAAELVTPASWMAAVSADILMGPRRLLDLFPGSVGERCPQPARPAAAMALIDEALTAERSVTLLVEGDAAGDRLVRRVLRRIGASRCRVLPGLSVGATAMARLRLDVLDFRVVDPLDGGDDDEAGAPIPLPPPDESWNDAEDLVLSANAAESWHWATALAERLNVTHDVYVCENLSLPGERVVRMDAYEMRGWMPRALTVVVLARKNAAAPGE